MGLSKYKLGKLLVLCDERNSIGGYSLDDVRGISIKKEFIETKADMAGVSLTPYILVYPDSFAYVPVTSRNGEKITIAHNTSDNTYIVSSSYIVFKVGRPDILLSNYLFMYFNRLEFDRYARFNSWGSARETFSWDDFCDIEIALPDIEQQRKYVNVYLALQKNLEAYQSKVEDLKTVYDGYFDKAKKENTITLGTIIEKVDKRNTDGSYKEESVRGITNKKQFDITKADLIGTNLNKFLVIDKDVFAYNSRTDGRDMLVLALNNTSESVIVTFNYNAFKIKREYQSVVNAEYIYAFFHRTEFDRRVRFNSWGSSQELLSWDNLCDIKVPFPPKKIQDSIAAISKAYLERKAIAESLKNQIKNLCPTLIKGSLLTNN